MPCNMLPLSHNVLHPKITYAREGKNQPEITAKGPVLSADTRVQTGERLPS